MKFLLLPARSTSEWDSATFALIELNPKFESEIKGKIKRQLELEAEGINGVYFYADNAEFYIDETQLPENLINDEGNVKGGVVEFDQSFIDTLVQPEQEIRYGQVMFNNGGVKFVGYGKHTDEEFYTESIGLNDEGNFDKI